MDKTIPLVSIIIPIHNGQDYLPQTLASLIHINYPNYEVILVNDGSTDASGQMCAEFAKGKKNIKYIDLKINRGLAYALNYGIDHTKGTYIARLNQDDIIMPDRIKKQIEFLVSNPDYSAVGSAIELFNDKQETVDKVTFPQTDAEIKKNWLVFSPFADPAVMYRKDSFLKTSHYMDTFWPVDDVHMWYELGKQGKLANLPEVLTKVRWHKEAGSIKNHRIQVKNLFKLHLWANKHVRKANIIEWIFWISQLVAGLVFPPRLNWYVFRLLRKCSFR